MRVLLVGAPGSLKSETYVSLFSDHDHWQFDLGLPPDLGTPDAPAIGSLADYRTELYIAAYRTISRDWKDVNIYYTSLIDSIAHSSVRLAFNLHTPISDELNERLMMTTAMIGAFARDSLTFDLIGYFPGYEGDHEGFNNRLAEFYPQLLEAMAIDHVVLDADVTENADRLVTLIADVLEASN